MPSLLYIYDAYCGWCYGFSDRLPCDVVSGGMILPAKPAHISKSAGFILNTYKKVEEITGIKFGEDYLWHIKNPEESDWYPNSEKPSIAMCIFKEFYPARAVEFAGDLQRALYSEGRDLTDDEAYRHLLEKYSIRAETFYAKLGSEEYRAEAYAEFEFVKQLQVTGFPAVFVQVSDSKYFMVASGYTAHDTLAGAIDSVLQETE